MFENHFYNESTRRMVSVFGSIFNDMEVVKKDAAGKVLQKIKVPLGYAPRSKILARLNPEDTKTHRKLGALYATKDETQKSLRHYNVVTRLYPNDVNAHRILANYYGKKGESLKAAPHYRELVRLDPNFALAYNELRQETGKFSIIKNWFIYAIKSIS